MGMVKWSPDTSLKAVINAFHHGIKSVREALTGETRPDIARENLYAVRVGT